MKKLINRIKTLYWFWKLTKRCVDPDKWIIEIGKHDFGLPYVGGRQWLEMWTPESYLIANKSIKYK